MTINFRLRSTVAAFVALAISVGLALAVSAQTGRDLLWRVLTTEDGLLSNDLWSIHVDDEAVWLGTDRGIARYDGGWTNFYNSSELSDELLARSGLPSGRVVDFAPEREGQGLWAGADSGALSHWDGQDWEFAVSVASPLHAVAVLDDEILLGTEKGLLRYTPDDRAVVPDETFGVHAIHDLLVDGRQVWVGADDGLRLHDGKRWNHLLLPDPLSSVAVLSLWQSKDGRVWLGTEQGVLWYDPRSDQWAKELMPIFNERQVLMGVDALTGDREGHVWAGSVGGGARKFSPGSTAGEDLSRTNGGGLTTPLVRDLAIDAQGAIWFATPVGLFQYQQRTWLNQYLDGDGVDRRINAVNDLLYDSRGRLWIATAGAGLRLRLPPLVNTAERFFTAADGHLPVDGVNTLVEDAAGDIWAGTFAGLSRYHEGVWSTPISPDELPSPVITDLYADDEGLWIGTENGLVYFDASLNELSPIPALEGEVVEALAEDSEGTLWVGTSEDGIWIETPDGWRHAGQEGIELGGLPGARIVTGGLAPDPHTPGGMWVNVFDVGLVRWDGETWRVEQEGLPSNVLYRLFTSPDSGDLWVGSEGGISRHDGTTWETFTVSDGLQSTAIYAVASESGSALWFGGPEGLSRYEPDNSPPWIRLRSVEGSISADKGQQIYAGDAVLFHVTAGDLQTVHDKLKLFYRLDGKDWLPVDELPLVQTFADPQIVSISFMARDQAFNYSNILEQELTVVPPPAFLTLPFFGDVEQTLAGLLIALTALVVLGFGYVGYGLVQRRLRSYSAMVRGFNPYVSGEPIRTEDMFFGRRDLLVRIVNTLHNNSIMIHGERRIGKTTLLYQLASTLRQIDDPDFWFVTAYIDLEGTTQEGFFHYLIEEIAVAVQEMADEDDELAGALVSLQFHEVAATEYDDRDFSNDLRALIGALQQHAYRFHARRSLRLILLLDEMDAVSGYDNLVQQQLRRMFMRDFAATLGAVVAGIQISKEWDRVESPWFNLFNEIALQPFTREQAINLLVTPVRGIYRYQKEALAFIIDHSDGRPFRIQQLALEAVNHMLSQRRRTIKLQDVEAAAQQIEDGISASSRESSTLFSGERNTPPEELKDAGSVRDASERPESERPESEREEPEGEESEPAAEQASEQASG